MDLLGRKLRESLQNLPVRVQVLQDRQRLEESYEFTTCNAVIVFFLSTYKYKNSVLLPFFI